MVARRQLQRGRSNATRLADEGPSVPSPDATTSGIAIAPAASTTTASAPSHCHAPSRPKSPFVLLYPSAEPPSRSLSKSTRQATPALPALPLERLVVVPSPHNTAAGDQGMPAQPDTHTASPCACEDRPLAAPEAGVVQQVAGSTQQAAAAAAAAAAVAAAAPAAVDGSEAVSTSRRGTEGGGGGGGRRSSRSRASRDGGGGDSRKTVILLELIGSGASGKVFRGVCCSILNNITRPMNAFCCREVCGG